MSYITIKLMMMFKHQHGVLYGKRCHYNVNTESAEHRTSSDPLLAMQ